MLAKLLPAVVLCLVTANLALALPGTPAATAADDVRSCACFGGSDPSGPVEEPGPGTCMDWIVDECSTSDQCPSCG
jgi:hypothetical protein